MCLTSHNNKWLQLGREPKNIDDLCNLIHEEMKAQELIDDEEDIETLEIYNPTISELVNTENPHGITMEDIPRRAKVRVLAEEKTYRELSIFVKSPGVLDKSEQVDLVSGLPWHDGSSYVHFSDLCFRLCRTDPTTRIFTRMT